MANEAKLSHTAALILQAISSGSIYGLSVMERTGLPSGTVYPALRRLERAGLILGTWDEASGRRRRVYELTPAGARMLAAERGSWRQFAAAVTALLEPASGPAAP